MLLCTLISELMSQSGSGARMLMPLPARQLDPQVLTISLRAVSGFLRLRALSVPTLCARILELKGRG
jgi:hypothetical protein